MEGCKSGMEAVTVAAPPMQTSESNEISIIISQPRAASSKIMPFELTSDGSVSSQSHANPAEPSYARATHWHCWNKMIAEFLGTFILIFTVLSTIIMDEQHDGVESLLGIATSAGLAMTVLVLSLIHISGCHLNPAISISMAIFGHLPLAHLLSYMTAQILGSTAASFITKGIYHPVNLGIATIPKAKELIAVAVWATIMMNALVAGYMSI
ncbi:hypothetical protein PR202_gb28802 [Eleusine coracana subsp. coracana]|uniref:Uncharacterized protein n=1 Tax=Eleusine coracana subsp. coracana TaxID=191504 RepID=A0AAV5FVI9_ELECO|nr:hypothetical protein QOZ80_8BG0644980 [Eleusine coracana subsp. coracana]GJN39669.1 hypothetical protein PR202_gb28802 [Eleusine coracana subsp. coracana]